MTLKILPVKAIYEKVSSMLALWNDTLDNDVKYKVFSYQEVIDIKEGNLYFTIDSIALNTYGYYDITGVFYKDFNAKTVNKEPNFVIFDILNDNGDTLSYLETEDTYTIDTYSETAPHSRVLTLNFKGMINPVATTTKKIKEVGYNIKEIGAF